MALKQPLLQEGLPTLLECSCGETAQINTLPTTQAHQQKVIQSHPLTGFRAPSGLNPAAIAVAGSWACQALTPGSRSSSHAEAPPSRSTPIHPVVTGGVARLGMV